MKLHPHPSKTVAALSLAVAFLLPVPAVRAADAAFTLTLVSGTNSWDSAPWQLVSGSGSVPGAGDDILSLSGNSSAMSELFLNGAQAVDNLTKSSNEAFRIYNSNSAGATGSLTISEGLTVENGQIYLRSFDPTGQLTVSTSTLTLGSTTAGTTGRLQFGDHANYRNVNFTVTGTTTLKGVNAAVILGLGLTEADSLIDLGHLLFDNNTGGGIFIEHGVLNVASLRNQGGAEGLFVETGAALRLDGDAGDPNHPSGGANFSLAIYNGGRVEKTGSNLQTLSRAGGNPYTGGTLISGGVLAISNTENSGIGRGAVEIRDSGTLAGSGQVQLNNASVTVKAGGSIAPGADGVAGFNQLTLSGMNKSTSTVLEMEEGATFRFDLNASGESDRILFGHYAPGDLVLDSDGITVHVNGPLSENVTYTLFEFYSDYVGSAKVSSGLNSGFIMGSGFEGFNATFHYDEADFGGVGSITMTVAAIPEPGTAGLTLAALALAALLHHKRRH